MYVVFHPPLQAELDSSLVGAQELMKLRETLKIAEIKLIESRNMVEELKVQNKTKIKELELKVRISPGSLVYNNNMLVIILGLTLLNSMQPNCVQHGMRLSHT